MSDDRRDTGTPVSRRPALDRVRTGSSVEELTQAFVDNLYFLVGRVPVSASMHDYYMALALTVRDRAQMRAAETNLTYYMRGSRTVCYFSAEYLPGPFLANNLLNLGLTDNMREVLYRLGLDLDELLELEEEPGLGNGGLGRLAACYLDSMATLSIPSIGYGIRYEYGIFDQEIREGRQVEITDAWLKLGNPWELRRAEIAFPVSFGGSTQAFHDDEGRYRVRWTPHRQVQGVAYDTPILGYRNDTANLLRLWRAEACESFDFRAFNEGDYYAAVRNEIESENLTKVLYPNDQSQAGKQLRLEQQYFFVSCSLLDMIRIHLQTAENLDDFHVKYAAQLNDTHPAIAVVELMRLLVDEHGYDWEPAFEITRRTFAYTNHTLLPEALETWPVELIGRVLPRHLEILYELNHRFLAVVEGAGMDPERVRRLSLVDENGGRFIRMAHVATVGSHTVNGVSEMHSGLLKTTVLRDFHALWPEAFQNVTNGVTPRRFMALCNPELASLVSEHIGEEWVRDLSGLSELGPHAGDEGFRDRWAHARRRNKERLAALIEDRTGALVDPGSLFDVQVKRIHEYKRQHLNLLHVITLYQRIKSGELSDPTPRTFVFAGKAAPGYDMAKLIIELVHGVGSVVNDDPDVADSLKVVFLPDYNVKLAERIYPAADLSEQISLAGKEASGTGNMKMSLNGALTIGTLDGANVEIRDAVGAERFFDFGMTVEEVAAIAAEGYRPRSYYESDDRLREALDAISGGRFSGGDGRYRPIVDVLLGSDPYFVLADYASYVARQDDVSRLYRDGDAWIRASIETTARMGYFSSDRSVDEYAKKVWRVTPTPVTLDR